MKLHCQKGKREGSQKEKREGNRGREWEKGENTYPRTGGGLGGKWGTLMPKIALHFLT